MLLVGLRAGLAWVDSAIPFKMDSPLLQLVGGLAHYVDLPRVYLRSPYVMGDPRNHFISSYLRELFVSVNPTFLDGRINMRSWASVKPEITAALVRIYNPSPRVGELLMGQFASDESGRIESMVYAADSAGILKARIREWSTRSFFWFFCHHIGATHRNDCRYRSNRKFAAT